MKRTSIVRMKRLIRVANILFECEARRVGELKALELEIEQRIEANMDCLDRDDFQSPWPELVIKSVMKLSDQKSENARCLERQIERAVEAKVSLVGATNRLESEVQRLQRVSADATLEELADRISRRPR